MLIINKYIENLDSSTDITSKDVKITKIYNNFSKLYCYGFAAAFFVYVAVNMSMVLGLLPIVGAPLPIMSYGGSSMLSMMIGLGIVMSCKIYQRDDIK